MFSFQRVTTLAIAYSTPFHAHAQTTWYVDGDADPPYLGTAENPFLTFRQAITDNQNLADGDTVLVDDVDEYPYCYRGADNRGLTISDVITVKSANGPTNCIIDCQQSDRAFWIITYSGGVTRLEDFTIVNGYKANANGGAIKNSGAGEFRITNCVFEGSYVSGGVDLGYGGAIYNLSVDGAIVNCQFHENDAEKGGAVASFHGEVDIVNCSFTGNTATTWAGAVDGDWYHKASLTNCRFSGNRAPYGGAISSGYDCELTFINCTMTGNRATESGGAIFSSDCNDVLANCILWDNEVPDPDGEGPQIFLADASTMTVDCSDVEGGEEDVYIDDPNDSVLDWGEGNMSSNPLFDSPGYWTDPQSTPTDWTDDVWVDGDYEISDPDTPVLDAGDSDADLYDPDLDGNDRVQHCEVDMGAYEIEECDSDLDWSDDVDIADLAQLLGSYGETSGMTYWDGDLDCDGDVDLADLGELLGHYGNVCAGDSEGGGGGGGEEDAGGYVDVSVVPYDTGGYKGGGFNGEVDHFVFDLKIEVGDPNKDDWIVTGAVLDASNDATFRLSTTATTPDQYATFVAAPWTSLPGSATADVVGAYDPPDPNEVFTTTDINLGWYDRVSSNDGPATVMRLVIDVSEVEGADVSEGFGSVYFSTGGPTQQEDILVADLASGTSTADLAPALKSLSGEFYVKGE